MALPHICKVKQNTIDVGRDNGPGSSRRWVGEAFVPLARFVRDMFVA